MEPTTTNKNNDCYFFYYSTCTKGDSCGFRHEASALGCEVMCSYWQQGNCLNEHCNFRHMELKKDRKSIPCYWENQRGGCKKPHCPFLHSLERSASNETTINNPNKPTSELPSSKPVNQEWSNRQDDGKFDGSGTESDQGRGSSEAGSFIGSPAVDPLIVKFDEESDSEGVANPSPIKSQTSTRIPYCKTYEEIRLEEIQAESAAYYSYEPRDYLKNVIVGGGNNNNSGGNGGSSSGDGGGGKEKKISSVRTARITKLSIYGREKTPQVGKSSSSSSSSSLSSSLLLSSSSDLDFKILTLDEIKRRKKCSVNKIDTDKNINEIAIVNNDKINIENSENNKIRIENEDKTIENIKTPIKIKSIVDSRKRKLLNRKRVNDDDKIYEESKKRNITNVTVPPVRLRRSPKRFIQLDREFVESSINTQDKSVTNKLNNEITRVKQNLRKTEIEVRLCDSSTSDDISTLNQIPTMTFKKLDQVNVIPSKNHHTDPIDDFKLEQFIDDEHLNDDHDYLDTASDDILKDIDALLTEKTS